MYIKRIQNFTSRILLYVEIPEPPPLSSSFNPSARIHPNGVHERANKEG